MKQIRYVNYNLVGIPKVRTVSVEMSPLNIHVLKNPIIALTSNSLIPKDVMHIVSVAPMILSKHDNCKGITLDN